MFLSRLNPDYAATLEAQLPYVRVARNKFTANADVEYRKDVLEDLNTNSGVPSSTVVTSTTSLCSNTSRTGDYAVPVIDHATHVPFSAGYTSRRLQQFLTKTFHGTQWSFLIHPFVSMVSQPNKPLDDWEGQSGKPCPPTLDMATRTLEHQFIATFWTSLHGIFPITMKSEFESLYSSLRTTSAPSNLPVTRRQSALVDSIMALTLQFTRGEIGGNGREMANTTTEHSLPATSLPIKDALRLGQEYYDRSNSLLQSELENPTSYTLQTCIYHIVYLYHASRFNSAHHFVALTLSVARSRQDRMPPNGDASPIEVETESRAWAALYHLDSIIAITLGRTPLLNSVGTNRLLSANYRYGIDTAGPQLWPATNIGITWLTFQEEQLKLTHLIRGFQADLGEDFMALFESLDYQGTSNSPELLERIASFESFLNTRLSGELYEWKKALPILLKIEDTLLDNQHSEQSKPLWVKRQQLQLKISYHSLLLSTYRPFLRLSTRSADGTGAADGKQPALTALSEKLVASCLEHALALTGIFARIPTQPDVSQVWPTMVQLQWEATICILMFIMGGYDTEADLKARVGLDLAKTALDRMSKYDSSAISCLAEARKLESAEKSLRRMALYADGPSNCSNESQSTSASSSGAYALTTTNPPSPPAFAIGYSPIFHTAESLDVSASVPFLNTTVFPAPGTNYGTNGPPAPTSSPVSFSSSSLTAVDSNDETFSSASTTLDFSSYGSYYGSSSSASSSPTSSTGSHPEHNRMAALVQHVPEGMANPFPFPLQNLNLQLVELTYHAAPPTVSSNTFGFDQQTSMPTNMPQFPSMTLPQPGSMAGTMFVDGLQWPEQSNNMDYTNDWQAQDQEPN